MICVLSFSYKNLDIAVREQIAFPQDQIKEFYTSLFSAFCQIKECVLLSTCNRFELLMDIENTCDTKSCQKEFIAFIASYRQIPFEILQKGSQFFTHQDAIAHIFRVASSLDSLVIGETQITGQLKNAYKLAYELKFCHKELTRVMHFAFRCASLVRGQTQISQNPISVASVAIAHFLKLASPSQKVIVVGTGEIGILCVKYLLNHGFEVILLSRTLQKAQNFQKELNAEHLSVEPMERLSEIINLHPYMFCATGASNTIITQEMIRDCDFQRIWFDLALPRDIEHFQREDITLFSIDSLQAIIASNKDKREEEAKKAQEIIEVQIKAFYHWLESLEVEPLIKALREQAKQYCIDEVARSVKKGFLNPQEEEGVLRILHNAFNKFLHHPTLYIKTIKENPESDFVIESIKKLFDLDQVGVFNDPYKCEKYHKDNK